MIFFLVYHKRVTQQVWKIGDARVAVYLAREMAGSVKSRFVTEALFLTDLGQEVASLRKRLSKLSNRSLATITLGQANINFEMVRLGGAWVYRHYTSDEDMLIAEADAKGDKRGLWALQDDQRVAPWDWRKTGKIAKGKASAVEKVSKTCGAKKFCKEMASCSEAKFYLNSCGLLSLDGDGDGIPCERMCR